jgi:hypothetical protein
VTVKSTLSEKEKKYYVLAKYDKGLWNIEIFEDKKPDKF